MDRVEERDDALNELRDIAVELIANGDSTGDRLWEIFKCFEQSDDLSEIAKGR